jgi:Fe2+ transport system protein FeoA
MRIDELLPGQGGTIERVGGEGELRDRLLDMGLTPGTHILLRKAAPLGDPIQLSLRGYELTIRKADAARIAVRIAAEGCFSAGSGTCGNCAGCTDFVNAADERAEVSG